MATQQITVDPYSATAFNPNVYTDPTKPPVATPGVQVVNPLTAAPQGTGLITTAGTPSMADIKMPDPKAVPGQATPAAAIATDPAAFTPAQFDNTTYLANKAAQLNSTGYQGRTNWTPEDADAAIKSSGLSLQDHYAQFGIKEGVSPYASSTGTTTPPPVDEPVTPPPVVTPDPTDNIAVGVTEPLTEGPADKPPVLGDAPTQKMQGSQDPMYWSSMIGNLKPPTFEARDIKQEETVAYQLSKLLNSDSPYMESARASAAEEANARGLLFSSLASEASQKAAIDAGAPIAAQDASTYAASALSAQNATQAAAMAKFDAQLSTVGRAQEGYIQSILNLEKFQYDQVMQSDKYAFDDLMQDEKYKYESQMSKQKAEQEKVLQKQKDDAYADLQLEIKKIDANLKIEEIAQADRGNFAQAINPVMQQYQNTFQAIQSTPNDVMDMDAKAWALMSAQLTYRDQITALAAVYQYPIEWPYNDYHGAETYGA